MEVKQLGRETEHSPPSSAEVMELCLHSPNTPLWHCAQLRKKEAQEQRNVYSSVCTVTGYPGFDS